jgi:hypothetical protein
MVCYDGFLQGFQPPLVIIITNHRDDPGPSTSEPHPRETHRCSRCHKLGHYGGNCHVTEVKQKPAAARESAPKLSRPTAVLPKGRPPVSDRPRGPHFGEECWENKEFENSTPNISDDEEAPSRRHEDKLEKAGMWLDSSSPPGRLVFSPRVTVPCPRPSILGRLGDPPNITDLQENQRTEVVLGFVF